MVKERQEDLAHTKLVLKEAKRLAAAKVPIKDRWYGKWFHRPVVAVTNPLVKLNNSLKTQMEKTPLDLEFDSLTQEASNILKTGAVFQSSEDKGSQKMVILAAKHQMRMEQFRQENPLSDEDNEAMMDMEDAMACLVKKLRPERTEEETRQLEDAKAVLDEAIEVLGAGAVA